MGLVNIGRAHGIRQTSLAIRVKAKPDLILHRPDVIRQYIFFDVGKKRFDLKEFHVTIALYHAEAIVVGFSGVHANSPGAHKRLATLSSSVAAHHRLVCVLPAGSTRSLAR